MTQEKLSRRSFIKYSGVTGSVAGLGASAKVRSMGSVETLRIGVIGPGGRGLGHVIVLSELKKEGASIDLVVYH